MHRMENGSRVQVEAVRLVNRAVVIMDQMENGSLGPADQVHLGPVVMWVQMENGFQVQVVPTNNTAATLVKTGNGTRVQVVVDLLQVRAAEVMDLTGSGYLAQGVEAHLVKGADISDRMVSGYRQEDPVSKVATLGRTANGCQA